MECEFRVTDEEGRHHYFETSKEATTYAAGLKLPVYQAKEVGYTFNWEMYWSPAPDWDKYFPSGKEQRPSRDLPISKDDQLNLVIALNTTKDVEQFLQTV